MTGVELLALLAGVALGAVLRQPKAKLVLVSETEAIARIRSRLTRDIEVCRERLLSDDCGWSEGDTLRRTINLYERILNTVPDQPA